MPDRFDGGPRLPLAAPPADGSARPGRWITWRSVLLGTLAVAVVCGVTPYNDYVVANTFMIGSYLPPVLVVWFFFLIVLINGPLHRWAPRHALSSGELAVIMAMMLVSCSLPSQGLMRSFLPMLVVPFHFGNTHPEFWEVFVGMGLPDWLFPVERIEDGRLSPIVTSFYHRIDEDGSIPWQAWMIPIAAWGVFFLGMFCALVAMAILLRGQWINNERLPFPILQLQIALIEQPGPGRMLNALLGSRLFWIALLGVILVRSTAALHAYFPQYVPEIPLHYNLQSIFTEEPWRYLNWHVQTATIYFTFIGITYFIQARIAFSLWAFVLIIQVVTVQSHMVQSEIPMAAWMDQYLGAAVAFVIGFLWIGRHHWKLVLRQTLRGERPDEPRGLYLSHRGGMILLFSGIVLMLGWLLFMGVTAWVAVTIVGFILLAHLVVARIVAETGLPFIRAYTTFPQVYTNLPPALLTTPDAYFAKTFTTLTGAYLTRESVLAYGMHGLQTYESTQPSHRQRMGLLLLIAWALGIGFVIAAASSLYCYYTYSTPISDRAPPLINPDGVEAWPRQHLVQPLTQQAQGRYAPKAHNPWLHMGIGLTVTAGLQVAALGWASWPLMPIGYLICHTGYAHLAWFSIFLGWLAKVLIVKYGGARLFQQAKPFFVGIIFGEALATGLWLFINLALAAGGYEYERLLFLPA